MVGRVCRLVDDVEIDVNKTTFVEKVRKLKEYLFGVHKEGTFLERSLALEGGKGIGFLSTMIATVLIMWHSGMDSM